MNILMTGATGFIGSHLLHAFLQEGYRVVVIKRITSNMGRISSELNDVVFYDSNDSSLECAFNENEIDVIVHVACNYGRTTKELSILIDDNVVFGVKLLDLAKRYLVKYFINTDTFFNNDKVGQKYLQAYILSKRMFIDSLSYFSDFVTVINLKLQHVYGPGDDVSKFIPWILEQLRNGIKSIDLSEGNQTRDFVYVNDVVNAYVTVLRHLPQLPRYSNFEVGSGTIISLRTFVEELSSQYATLTGSPTTKLNFGVLPYKDGELLTVDVDIDPLKNLGWHPSVQYKEGIKKIISLY